MCAPSPIHRWRWVAGALVTTGIVALVGTPVEGQSDPSTVWRAPNAQERPPVGRVTGGRALEKEKGQFKETWVHPDARLGRYSSLYVWNAVFQFRPVGRERALGTNASILRSTGREEYAVDEESRERFKQVFVDTLSSELGRSGRFQVVDEVGPGTLVVRAAVLDIVCVVPPSTARVDVYLGEVGEGTVVFELIDPQTGLMQARVGERSNIAPPGIDHTPFTRPATVNTMWVDVERWARAVGEDLRSELEKRLEAENR